MAPYFYSAFLTLSFLYVFSISTSLIFPHPSTSTTSCTLSQYHIPLQSYLSFIYSLKSHPFIALIAHPTHSSMANEGTLNLDCIAADPKSEYLYGISSANTSPHTNYADSHILLVRSNLDPTNLAGMTWSVVSSSTSSELSYNYPTFTSVDCTVSEQGDFTAFVRSPHRVFSETAMVPMGVRYIRQSGTWSNIYGPAVYGWISDAFVHKSFYMDDNLIHMVTGEYADRMRIGILDTSTNSLQLISSNKWVNILALFNHSPNDFGREDTHV